MKIWAPEPKKPKKIRKKNGFYGGFTFQIFIDYIFSGKVWTNSFNNQLQL